MFRDEVDAKRWQEASTKLGKITYVYLSHMPSWQMSRGTLRDMVLASKMYGNRPDHRHQMSPSAPTCWPVYGKS